MPLSEAESAAFRELTRKAGEAPPPPRTLKEVLHKIIDVIVSEGSQVHADLHTGVNGLPDTQPVPVAPVIPQGGE